MTRSLHNCEMIDNSSIGHVPNMMNSICHTETNIPWSWHMWVVQMIMNINESTIYPNYLTVTKSCHGKIWTKTLRFLTILFSHDIWVHQFYKLFLDAQSKFKILFWCWNVVGMVIQLLRPTSMKPLGCYSACWTVQWSEHLVELVIGYFNNHLC